MTLQADLPYKRTQFTIKRHFWAMKWQFYIRFDFITGDFISGFYCMVFLTTFRLFGHLENIVLVWNFGHFGYMVNFTRTKPRTIYPELSVLTGFGFYPPNVTVPLCGSVTLLCQSATRGPSDEHRNRQRMWIWKRVHYWASRHSQVFKDKNLGSSPGLLGQ